MHETLISLNSGETEKNFSPFNLSLSSFLVWTDPFPHLVAAVSQDLLPRWLPRLLWATPLFCSGRMGSEDPALQTPPLIQQVFLYLCGLTSF